MRIEHAQVYRDGELVWDDVAGEINDALETLAVRDRGMPGIGNFELRLEDGTAIVMRSGAPASARVGPGNIAYFTFNAIWK